MRSKLEVLSNKIKPVRCGDTSNFPKKSKKILPWVEGPEFLLLPECEWPSLPAADDQVNKVVSSFLSADDIKTENEIYCSNPFEKFIAFVNHYSDFHRLIRSLCYIFRVVKAYLIKNDKEKRKFLQLSISPLTAQERSIAEDYVIKLVQKDCFGKLYDYVRSLNGDVCCKVKKDLKIAFQPLKMLSVFCNHAGLLRSHSRTINADRSYDARFPIILPKQHNFVEC